MRILELLQDSGNDKLSVTKLWMHIGYAAATWAFLKSGAAMGAELWLVYLGVIGGSDVAKKFIASRKDVLMAGAHKPDSGGGR